MKKRKASQENGERREDGKSLKKIENRSREDQEMIGKNWEKIEKR